MSMDTRDASDGVKVFDIIECPICGFNNFTDGGIGAGVSCDECGTQFKVRECGSDAGCVVDASFGDVYNVTGTAGVRAYRRALKDLGYYVETKYPHVDPIWTAMRILKCPDEYGRSHDDRGWCLVPTRYHPKPSEASVSIQTKLADPIVGRYRALAAGHVMEREESEAEYRRNRDAEAHKAKQEAEADSVH